MKAIILAGGKGLRLRPLTDDRPKPMVQVNGRPIAELQLDWLKRSGMVDGVVFLTGYLSEALQSHFGTSYNGLAVGYSVEESPLGTGGAVKRALQGPAKSSDDVVVMNGDVLTDLPLEKMVASHRASATRATVTMLLVPYKSRFGTVYMDERKVVRKFEEKPVFPDVWINGGVYVINSTRIMKDLPDLGDIERTTFPKLVPKGEMAAFPYEGFWTLIDSIKDLQEAEGQLKVLETR